MTSAHVREQQMFIDYHQMRIRQMEAILRADQTTQTLNDWMWRSALVGPNLMTISQQLVATSVLETYNDALIDYYNGEAPDPRDGMPEFIRDQVRDQIDQHQSEIDRLQDRIDNYQDGTALERDPITEWESYQERLQEQYDWYREVYERLEEALRDYDENGNLPFNKETEELFREQAIEYQRLWREVGSEMGYVDDVLNTLKGLYDILDPATLEELIEYLKGLFDSAERQASPIILDLDGTGINTVGFDSDVYFDHDGNGFAQLTGWVGANDGLLVWDRDGNGVIDNGGELFGDNTVLTNGLTAVNGFAALAEHDSNGDGIIDANDAIWAELRVWRDVSQDGVTREGELVTLDELGITSINLAYTTSTYVDEHGNAHKQVGSFTWADGTEGIATDVWFATDNARTRAIDLIEVSEQIAALPDLEAFGNMHSLHQAMARDESGRLQELVEQFMAETDRSVRSQLMTDILYEWVGVSDLDPTSRGVYIDARTVAVLETFLGEPFLQAGSPNPRQQAAALLEQAFGELAKAMYSDLMLQTHLKPYIESIEIVFAEDGIELDFSPIHGMFADYREQDRLKALDELIEFNQIAGKNLASLGWAGTNMLLGWLQEDYGTGDLPEGFESEFVIHGSGTLRGTADDNILIGDESHNTLYGTGGSNLLIAGGGNNYLYGGTGDNIFVMGSGTDRLYSQTTSSNDVYRFGRGDGTNTIYDYGGSDVIDLGEGISEEHVTVRRSGSSLVLTLDTGDSVTVAGMFNSSTGALNENRAVELIRFADGTEWDIDRMREEALRTGDGGVTVYGFETDDVIEGGAGNDRLYAGGGNNTLIAGGGNNWLYGGAGDDTLIGGSGNDYLYGQGGNNLLIAGGGNNYLYGGNGDNIFVMGSGTDRLYSQTTSSNDIYRFGRGDGSNTIYDYGGSDVIELGEGIAEEHVTLRRNGSSLVLTLDTGESVTVASMFNHSTGALNTNRAVEGIRFADGTEWDIDRMREEALRTADGGVTIYGFETDDVIQGGSGNDRLHAGGGNNTLIAGGGNNWLYGGAGDDTLIGGSGNDYLYGQGGNNLLIAGGGNNYLYGGNGDNIFVMGGGTDRLYSQTTSSNDVYRLGRGSGQNYIYDYGGWDVIELGEGISEEHVTLRRSGSSLVLTLDTGESVAAASMFNHSTGALNTNRAVEGIRFADGTEWDIDRMRDEALRLTEGNNTIYGFETDDTIQGGAGNDRLHGGGGNNTLIAGGGNNWLYGGAGDDTLIGGSGNDYLYGQGGNNLLIAGGGNNYLYGGTGDNVFVMGGGTDRLYSQSTSSNDVYRLGRGSGQNYIYDYGGSDVIELGEGISEEHVTLRRSGSSLVLTLDTGESVTVASMFNHSTGALNTNRAVEVIRFADGTEWDIDRMRDEALRLTEGNNIIYGFTTDDVIEGGAGNDRLYGGSGNNTLIAGGGNNYLFGGAGDDTLIGGEGSNYLYGGAGHDLLIAGVGDRLYGEDGDDILAAARNAYLYGGRGADQYHFQGDYHGARVYSVSGAPNIEDAAFFNDSAPENLWFHQSGNDLVVDVIGKENRVTFSGWYANADNRLGEIHAGGLVADANQIDQLVLAMAEFAPEGGGVYSELPDDVRNALAPALASNWSSAA
jgi:Ca2+-binding RTX toxin-like protein